MTTASVLPIDSIAYRPRQMARMLGVSEKTLRNWVLERNLPARRVNRAVLFVRSEVVAWLASQDFSDGVTP